MQTLSLSSFTFHVTVVGSKGEGVIGGPVVTSAVDDVVASVNRKEHSQVTWGILKWY